MKYIKMYGIALIITGVFFIFKLPLPWILGPLIGVFLLKQWGNSSYQLNEEVRHISFGITGVQIGATFTAATISQVMPYFLPFLFFTIALIAISMLSGVLIAKIAKMEQITGVLGSVPGGLSVMVAMSDSLKSNTGLVAIFHTIRLLSVLFIVPIIATYIFSEPVANSYKDITAVHTAPVWTVFFYGVFYFLAHLLQYKIPAAHVLIPMIFIAIFNIFGVPIISLHPLLFHFAQVSIGIHLGLSIDWKDIKKAGKYTMLYFCFTCAIILISVLFGYIFSSMSGLSFATGMLSMAPGGLVEMAITAHEVGADPAIVGSLQLVRMLLIILIMPYILTRIWSKQ